MLSNKGACVICSCLCKRWSLKANKENHLHFLLLKLGNPLQRSSRLQEVVGALEGKESEEHEKCDNCEKMEDPSIKANTNDVDYTLGTILLTLFFFSNSLGYYVIKNNLLLF